MNKDFLIQLTSNLYRLTLFFPKKEPLRYKMREVADDILISPSEKDLEILNSFFEVAKTQNWVSPFDVLAIQKDYDSLKEEIKLVSSKNSQIFPAPNSSEVLPRIINNEGNAVQRRQRIIDFLRENGRAQVWEVKQLFPEVTKRTLRRDFEQMLEQGLVERIGEKNNTFYQACPLARQVKTFDA
jgi:hypothetical protein